jgi:nicotinamide mononucleotide (NMN) deamidase PncC
VVSTPSNSCSCATFGRNPNNLVLFVMHCLLIKFSSMNSYLPVSFSLGLGLVSKVLVSISVSSEIFYRDLVSVSVSAKKHGLAAALVKMHNLLQVQNSQQITRASLW